MPSGSEQHAFNPYQDSLRRNFCRVCDRIKSVHPNSGNDERLEQIRRWRMLYSAYHSNPTVDLARAFQEIDYLLSLIPVSTQPAEPKRCTNCGHQYCLDCAPSCCECGIEVVATASPLTVPKCVKCGWHGSAEYCLRCGGSLSNRCTCDHFEHKETGECVTCGMFCGPVSNRVGQETMKAWAGEFPTAQGDTAEESK